MVTTDNETKYSLFSFSPPQIPNPDWLIWLQQSGFQRYFRDYLMCAFKMS